MTAFWDGKERRRDVRIPKTLNVKYIIEKRPRSLKSSSTKNIGGGGILIETEEKLSVETFLELEISVPGRQKSVLADGKVVWVKEVANTNPEGKRMFNAGVRFAYMSPQERIFFLDYVKNLCS